MKNENENRLNAIGLCSANVERSRTFQAVMEYETEEQKLNERIKVYSAGLNVEKIIAAQSPLRIQVNILKGGLDYKVVRSEILDEVKQIVSQGYDQQHTDRIKSLYAEVRPMVHDINTRYVNQALMEAKIPIRNISSPFKTFQPQTGFGLALPMAKKDIAKVDKKYQSLNLEQPPTMAYGSLVGTEDLQDKNMASGIQGARKKVEYFMDTRKKAVEELLKYVS